MAGRWLQFSLKNNQLATACRAGKYDLHLLVMCDSYIGADRVVPVRLMVQTPSRAQRKQDAASKQQDSDEESAGMLWRALAQWCYMTYVRV